MVLCMWSTAIVEANRCEQQHKYGANVAKVVEKEGFRPSSPGKNSRRHPSFLGRIHTFPMLVGGGYDRCMSCWIKRLTLQHPLSVFSRHPEIFDSQRCTCGVHHTVDSNGLRYGTSDWLPGEHSESLCIKPESTIPCSIPSRPG